MTQTPIKINTLEDYLSFDDGTDKQYVLEDGVLVEMPPETGKHEAIITLLLVYFFLEIQKSKLPLQPRPNGTEVLTNKQKRLSSKNVSIQNPESRIQHERDFYSQAELFSTNITNVYS